MDPFAGDEDFVWLALNKKKHMEEVAAMKYDGKTSVYITDAKEGFVKANIVSTEGDNVKCAKEEGGDVTLKADQCHQMNPPKFFKNEDMANLTYLNEAAVLVNLRDRYQAGLIYTYSGLFCVTINPYRRLPIYTKNVCDKYRGKRKNEMPPHLFSVADNAFANMLQDRANQSCLITGESGAGKTENTKKVISYFASVAAGKGGKKESEKSEAEKKGSLEDAIVQANPVLEAYGNSKTVRNNNSSRFGKFIRIHFGPDGKIAGADIETYLLEKSRVTYQMPGVERNYHIFYWLLSNAIPEYNDKLLVTPDPGNFFFINQGCLDVENMDDKKEMMDTDGAFAVLGFTEEQKISIYKVTCAVLWFGEMKFKQRPREEQAEPEGTAEAEKVAFLLGINSTDLIKALCTPKVKVGTEWVVKSQSLNQVNFSVGALSKCIYARLFGSLVITVNKTLDTKSRKAYFIGVLDIAGFEIFDYNTLEQLCINYTNERLQQFFNHHMFVLEQEEYKKEGIVWEFIDFGMDLAACIELIEKPMGIFSILEEECMFPKASDDTFKAKLYENHMGKSKSFGKPRPSKTAVKGFEPHFELHHYAGSVGYNIAGWLNKNKDPIMDCVVIMMQGAKEPLVASFFAEPAEEAGGGKKKKKKGSAYQTISATHREQLHKLMHTLYSTHPHFVRCIIPNEVKTPGLVDAALVMHQLQCNGVLEGIRICRKGFPNRMLYPEFKQRYSILAGKLIEGKEAKEATAATITFLKMDDDARCGNTKVFFKAGVLGQLEDVREERLSKIFTMFQAHARAYLMLKNYQKLCDQRVGVELIQRNIRAWLNLRDWKWWKLYTSMKPLLSAMKSEEEAGKIIEELKQTKEKMEKLEKMKVALEEQQVELTAAKNELVMQLEAEGNNVVEQEEEIESLVKAKAEGEAAIKDLEERLKEEEGGAAALEAGKKRKEAEVQDLKKNVQNLELNIQKAEQDKKTKDNQIKTLNDEMARQDEAIARLQKESKGMDEGSKKLTEDLQAEEDKANHLTKLKQKLESNIDDLNDNLEREKKNRAETEKAKKKLETDLKLTQETVEEYDRLKRDLEDKLKKRENEISNVTGKLEEESNLVAQLQKKVKELTSRIEELEEELDAEKAARYKVEKSRNDIKSELDEIAERLDEAGGATAAQADMNKKREAELVKLKRDMEEQSLQCDSQIASLRKKQQDACNDLSDQIDNLQKAKSKVEKEKQMLKAECDDLQGQIENFSKAKSNAERNAKNLEAALNDTNTKLDEISRQVNDLNSNKGRLQGEASELGRQLSDAEGQIHQLAKARASLAQQLDEAKAQLEEESRVRAKLQGDTRSLQSDLDALRESLEEEVEGRADMQRLLTKANNEAVEWRRKFDSGEGGVNAEAADDMKRKMNSKLADLESQLEAALSKSNSMEKARNRLQGELEDLMIEVERSTSIANHAEKRQRGFDKVIGEWKRKTSDLQSELENSQRESRANAAEVYKFRSTIEESRDTVEALRRENKNLSDEIHDITDQLGEGGRSVHELEKSRKRLEMEKEELQSALEEAEAALEQEEAKVMRAQLEIAAIRQDIDRRLTEKDEEFDNTRKNHQRSLDSMQASLEAESRGKSEALRMKKKLEADINELEVALDGANRGRAEAEKNIKKYQQSIRELQQACEEQQRARDEAREQYAAAERRANMIAGEVEELRTQLESAERARKAAESELHEASDRVSELSTANASLMAAKRKLETDIQAMQSDLDDQSNELKAAEDHAKKAMADAARIAEELRQEQEHSSHIEKLRRTLESQVKELQVRLDEAEASSLKGGKRMIQKLEQRVRELEVELDNEQRRHTETQKNMRKQDRHLKELSFQADEDRKNQERMTDMADKLQQKIKTYKRQVEEAEEIAAINLAKYRKVQHELEDAEERADIAEGTLGKLRAKNRSSSSQTTTTTTSSGGMTIKVTETRSKVTASSS